MGGSNNAAYSYASHHPIINTKKRSISV